MNKKIIKIKSESECEPAVAGGAASPGGASAPGTRRM